MRHPQKTNTRAEGRGLHESGGEWRGARQSEEESEGPPASEENMIDRNLKLAFDAVAEEPLPNELAELLLSLSGSSADQSGK